MNQDPYATVEQEMGFGGDEPSHFLRLKNEGDTEVVIFNGLETVPANQKEMREGYHKNGNVVLYQFTSPLTGSERTHRTSGQALMIGLKNATSFERDAAGMQVIRKAMPGEPIRITRSGSGGDTRINVAILSQEELNEYVAKHTSPSDSQATPGSPSTSTHNPEPDPEPNMQTAPSSDEEINIEDIPF